MTIEQKINKKILFGKMVHIEYFPWSGKPYSIKKIKGWTVIHTRIDEAIKNADIVECLTSKSKYIRECKKWFMENK